MTDTTLGVPLIAVKSAFVDSLQPTSERGAHIDGLTEVKYGHDVPPNGSTWFISRLSVTLNMRDPFLRTDASSSRGVGFGSGITASQTIHPFTYLAAHEARHAWQKRIVLDSENPARYVNLEAPFDFSPDNNDDFQFYTGESISVNPDPFVSVGSDQAHKNHVIDCLPKKAYLADGTPISGMVGPFNSANVIVDDTAANLEFGVNAPAGGPRIHGEKPGSVGGNAPTPANATAAAALADTCVVATSAGTIAVERDAIRFGRAIANHIP